MEASLHTRRGFRRGQAMAEYVIATVCLLAVFTVLGYLVTAAQKSAERTTNLVESDYP